MITLCELFQASAKLRLLRGSVLSHDSSSTPQVRFSCLRHEAALHLEIGDHGWSSLPSPMLQSSIPTASALLQAATTDDQASTATSSCLL
ncbi:hypothetical protein F2Q69_00034356 [Brassica cretica]|uniref:Uncharacterized protein n=1 Tax=Brassica cretica TaxID=69181 RepID=A0A8S9SGW1_BRACR|nr:hypothetical protein F2Q69_00034356 [Brassica cretica]